MTGKTYFITGVNRGIGLRLLKLISEDSSNTVIGTARDLSTATELSDFAKEHSNVHLVTLDVSSQDSIDKLDSQLAPIAKDGIDAFISNAAFAGTYQPVLEVEREDWIKTYVTNVVGPIEITKVLKKYLLKKETRQLIFVSSIVGSLSSFFPISTAAYGQSKSALNHTILTLSFELKPEGFTVVAVHPGSVSSDMGNYAKGLLIPQHGDAVADFFNNHTITPEQSASDQVNNVYYKLTKEDNGKFFSYDGTEIPY